MQGTNIIAVKLNQLRLHYKVPIELVASKSGIPLNNLMSYEAGTAMPSQQELIVLARLYRIKIDFFIPQGQAYPYQATRQSHSQPQQYSQPQYQRTQYSQPVQQTMQYSQPYVANTQSIPQSQMYANTVQQAYVQPPIQNMSVSQLTQDVKSTRAYENRNKRLKALRRAAITRLFTFISILVLGGIGCCIYFLQFGSFSFPVEHYGQDVIVTADLTGMGLLKQFLHGDFFVRLLSINIYSVMGFGGLLAFIQLLRLVSKSVFLRFIARCLTHIMICCFLMASVCFVKLFDFHALGFILYLVGLFLCIVPLFISFLKGVKIE